MKTKDLEKNLESSKREITHLTCMRKANRTTMDFSSETMGARKVWHNTSQVIKEKEPESFTK